MSIITEAMRKAAIKRAAGEVPPQRTRTARVARGFDNVDPDQAAAAAARFQEVSLVPHDGSEYVLPRLTDRAARRSYKILRTRTLQGLSAHQWRSVAITAAGGAGAGKTLTAVNLALALAQDPNTWVFLVDLDLQRPKVAPTLGLPVEKGLTDYLLGEASIEEVIYSPRVDRLAVIPNGRPIEQSSEQLLSPRMGQFMEFLENESPRRIIIYDVPPLLVSDDVLVVASQIDCVLLVATQGITPRANLEQAQDVLSEMNVLGVVLNRSSERDDSPYY